MKKEKKMKLETVYKDENVIVIVKPIGMPSQSDPTGDKDAMSATSEMLAEIGEKDALWLVHRLDRNVSGLLAFARNKKSASALSEIIASGRLTKKYLAVCHGKAEEGRYTDFIYKDSTTSKAYVVKTERRGAKEAKLSLSLLGYEDDKSLVSVTLETGRFHQIRAQLSSRSHSLVGDKKYGSRDAKRRTPCLFSHELTFELFGKKISANALPNIEEYPWNIFSKDLYERIESNDE